MRKALEILPKNNPMTRNILTICVVLMMTSANAQTSITSINVGVDSADFFLQKGLLEKKNGRRLESLKNFEKAAKYDATSKSIVVELASAYLDLRRYGQARESYKKLVELGDATADNYKQLMTLSFQLKQNELNLEKDYSGRIMNIISAQQMLNLRKAEQDFRLLIINQLQQRRAMQQRKEILRDQNQRLRQKK